MKYKHYVITLFNLNLKWSGSNAGLIDEEYLKKRFELFDKYCYPSFINQTNLNFKWLLLFSDGTSMEFKKIIESYSSDIFVPIFIKDEESNNFKSIVANYVKNDSLDCDYVVTTRCDNDDIISKNFIKRIQEYLDNHEINNELFLVFPRGYQYEVKKNILLNYYFPTNHFSSYVSFKKDKTIHDFRHMEIRSNTVVDLCGDSHMWIEVIHDTNIYNMFGTKKISDYVKVFDLKDEFNVNIFGKHNRKIVLLYYIIFSTKKLFKKTVKKVFRRG